MTEKAFSTRSSKESDVYAYGVVLLELITGKMAVDPSFSQEMSIVEWAESIWSETKDVDLIVDPNLADELIDLSVKEHVKDMLLLALRCTGKEAGKRPSMRDVVKQLILTNPNCRSKNTHASAWETQSIGSSSS